MAMTWCKQNVAQQKGAALVVGLIFLGALALMGVAAYAVAIQEERMSGDTRDRIRAFEAAEASLRDCESLLASFGPPPTFNGLNGMHEAAAPGMPQVFETIDWVTGSVRELPTPVPNVARQPRCIVERIGEIEVQKLDAERSGPQQLAVETVYRITAMGFGLRAETTMNLQTTYRAP